MIIHFRVVILCALLVLSDLIWISDSTPWCAIFVMLNIFIHSFYCCHLVCLFGKVWHNLNHWLNSLVCHFYYGSNTYSIAFTDFSWCAFLVLSDPFWIYDSTLRCAIFIMVSINICIHFTAVIWCAFVILSDLIWISDLTPWCAIFIMVPTYIFIQSTKHNTNYLVVIVIKLLYSQTRFP